VLRPTCEATDKRPRKRRFALKKELRLDNIAGSICSRPGADDESRVIRYLGCEAGPAIFSAGHRLPCARTDRAPRWIRFARVGLWWQGGVSRWRPAGPERSNAREKEFSTIRAMAERWGRTYPKLHDHCSSPKWGTARSLSRPDWMLMSGPLRINDYRPRQTPKCITFADQHACRDGGRWSRILQPFTGNWVSSNARIMLLHMFLKFCKGERGRRSMSRARHGSMHTWWRGEGNISFNLHNATIASRIGRTVIVLHTIPNL